MGLNFDRPKIANLASLYPWKFSYLSYHNAKLFIPYECTRGMFATTGWIRGVLRIDVWASEKERERARAREEREKRYRTNLANFHINLLDRSDTHTHIHTRAYTPTLFEQAISRTRSCVPRACVPSNTLDGATNSAN